MSEEDLIESYQQELSSLREQLEKERLSSDNLLKTARAQRDELEAECAAKDEALREIKNDVRLIGNGKYSGKFNQHFRELFYRTQGYEQIIEKALSLDCGSEMLRDKERLVRLADWIWATRWMNDDDRLRTGDQDYVDMVGVAAEIRSGNLAGIDKRLAIDEAMKKG